MPTLVVRFNNGKKSYPSRVIRILRGFRIDNPFIKHTIEHSVKRKPITAFMYYYIILTYAPINKNHNYH